MSKFDSEHVSKWRRTWRIYLLDEFSFSFFGRQTNPNYFRFPSIYFLPLSPLFSFLYSRFPSKISFLHRIFPHSSLSLILFIHPRKSTKVIMDKICETNPSYKEMKRLKKEDEMRTLVADGDFGLPLRCPCGGRMIDEISAGTRYLTCNLFKDDGLHIRKTWKLAIHEEVTMLRKEFDEKSKEGSLRVHELVINELRREVKSNTEEIAKLKELVASLVGRIEKLFGPIR